MDPSAISESLLQLIQFNQQLSLFSQFFPFLPLYSSSYPIIPAQFRATQSTGIRHQSYFIKDLLDNIEHEPRMDDFGRIGVFFFLGVLQSSTCQSFEILLVWRQKRSAKGVAGINWSVYPKRYYFRLNTRKLHKSYNFRNSFLSEILFLIGFSDIDCAFWTLQFCPEKEESSNNIQRSAGLWAREAIRGEEVSVECRKKWTGEEAGSHRDTGRSNFTKFNWFFQPLQVKIWLQNRRTKHKKTVSESQSNVSSNWQIFTQVMYARAFSLNVVVSTNKVWTSDRCTKMLLVGFS